MPLIVRRAAVPLVFVCAFTLSSLSAAIAAAGPWTVMGSINGRNWENRAEVETNVPGPHGVALVQTQGGAVAPSGHMGAQASLWKSVGLCRESGWSYSTSSASGWVQTTLGLGGCGAGNYYGDGQVGVWKPSIGSYVRGYPINSPYQTQN